MLFCILYGFRPRTYESDGAMRIDDDDGLGMNTLP